MSLLSHTLPYQYLDSCTVHHYVLFSGPLYLLIHGMIWDLIRSFPALVTENPHSCSSNIGRPTFLPIQYKFYIWHTEINMSFELNLMWYSVYKTHIISQAGLEHFTPKTNNRAIQCQSLLHLTNMFSWIIVQCVLLN
jgi:hypothetical protein